MIIAFICMMYLKFVFVNYSTPQPKDPNEEALELATPTDPVVELLKQGAGKEFLSFDFSFLSLQRIVGLIYQDS